jgi:3-oxoacyl-[acyl-carrier protein] reductase
MILQDKVAVVTGASDGIGKEVAFKLANKGVALALIGRDKTKLEKTKQEAEDLGSPKVMIYPCDIRKTKDLVEVIKKIISDFKNIYILVNVAGIWQKVAPLESISESVVDDVIQTNLIALIHCVRLLLPNLKKQEEAAIINISSVSGVVAKAGQSVYSASKWGVHGFTEVLKTDLKGTSVRVAGIYQAGTNTKMFEKAGDDFPVQKFTNPSDLADVIVYMLSLPKQIWLHEVRVEY